MRKDAVDWQDAQDVQKCERVVFEPEFNGLEPKWLRRIYPWIYPCIVRRR
jgi:hypothetical protein